MRAYETDQAGENHEGTVSAYTINRTDDQLTLINTVRSGGHGPTYVSLHPSGRFLLVANYFGGSAAVLPPGDGPRHFAFHPNGRWCYSLQEEASTIVLFDHDGARGRLSPRQTQSSLPLGFPAATSPRKSCFRRRAACLCRQPPARQHRDFLCWCERRADLRRRGVDARNYPRSFNFDPTGRFLYCCNQRGDNVTIFRVEQAAGVLMFTGHYTPVGNPSSIVFLDLAKTK